MAWPYDDDTSGPYGSVSQVPSNEWFGVNTATGEWQRPGGQPATLASSAGLPDVTAPAVMGGTPDEAPLAIGQVAGTLAPPMTIPASIGRVARADQAGLLTPQPSVWESIARGIGMASPLGRAYLQGFDQQQQQQLTNRLALRRQQLLEDQEARQATQTSLDTLRKISDMPNKTMRNLMFDRYVADMQGSGQPLPGDMVEAFKKSSLDEGKQMAQMLTPMFEAADIDLTAASQILQEGGDPKRLLEMIDMGLKAKKQKQDEQEEARITQQRAQYGAGTLGGVSGVQAPAPPTATTGIPPVAPAPPTARSTPEQDQAYRDYQARQTPAGGGTPPQQAIIAEAVKQGVPPALALSVAMQESYMNPNAEGDGGKSLGLFQLQKGAAIDAKIDPARRGEPALNIQGGITYLKQKLDQAKGDVAQALRLYNGGGDPNYVQHVMRHMPDSLRLVGQPGTAPDTRMQVAGPGAPAPAVPATDQAQLQALNNRIALADTLINQNMGSGRERTKGWVNELQQERTRLIAERKEILAPTREEETARRLQPLKLEQQRAGAEVSLEAKANEPIGVDNARKMGLPPSTRWKDVPKDVRILEDPGPTERQKFSDYTASHAGLGRVLTMLDQPGAKEIIGTIFSEGEAAVTRNLGTWLSTVKPEQRKFVAAMAAEIAEIRHQLSGAAVTPQEFAVLQPMLPSPADPDVATVRAKLEALREWIVRKHDAYRDQLDQVGIRTPKALERPASPPPLDPKAQQALDILKPKGK